ncbi:dTDP-4-dehydrorhamnose reductase [Qipengyuania sp. 1XM1-15A]|uniref:dTDP-4-dehydrorhamnose reductase n=1 Tax=Qipengyuania xiamenensis TaxID=2867237 RepID=UPI001C86D044|nr:dTDP-4-dehydrorhamnose reductase [Qipengyuania xiamenensis]MBX7531772.1 dTDP-4-dehydrorhamnose reductase [Qipengyuania xiamenensis]
MILVFGSTGQLAHELRLLDADLLFLSREQADLSRPRECAEAIVRHNPDAVINAAAFTDVDGAEEHESLAMLVNGAAPTAMAQACAAAGIPFVNVSSDYVFDGSGSGAWTVDAQTSPQNAYGRSKAAGEYGVRSAGGAYVNLRTSWVFSGHGRNFLTTMLALGKERDNLTIVADQIGGPTPASDLGVACLAIARKLVEEPSLAGTYHLSGAPDVSWADFARAIFAESGEDVKVVDIPTSEYPRPATRPLNSRMDCSGLAAFSLERPDWRKTVRNIIRSRGNS